MLAKYSLVGNHIDGKVRESLKIVTRTSLLLQSNIIEDNYINTIRRTSFSIQIKNILKECLRISSDHLFNEWHARFVTTRKIYLRFSIKIHNFQLGFMFNCKSSLQGHKGNSQISCLFKIGKVRYLPHYYLDFFLFGSYLKICFCDVQCRILIPFLGLIVILVFFFWI